MEYLKKQVDRQDDIVGDLALDAVEDEERPRANAGLQRWKQYLASKGAHPGAIDALEEAWREFGSKTNNRK